jgi:hypothetical protein
MKIVAATRQYHEIGSQLSHEVWLALPEATQTPTFDYPALRIVRLHGPAYAQGVETFTVDGSPLRVYHLDRIPARQRAPCGNHVRCADRRSRRCAGR